jgi:hypothetical protein
MSKCVEKLFNTNDEARRQKIENESGCELKKCSVYDISKYRKFRPHDFEAFFVPFNGAYQEKKYSDYKSPNFGDFIPSNSVKKCISKGNGCEEISRACEEIHYDKCNSYYSQSDKIQLEPKYVQKEDKSGCELKSCYFLNSNECSKFKFNGYKLKICAPNIDNIGCEFI